jgi:hypothetical protein
MLQGGSLSNHTESQLLLLDIHHFAGVKNCSVASGVAFGNVIGNPVRIRDGPATVIVEGWSTKPLIPLPGIGKAAGPTKRESGDLPEAG